MGISDFAVRVRTAETGKTHLFYIGQAGFIIKSLSGQLLAVDRPLYGHPPVLHRIHSYPASSGALLPSRILLKRTFL